MDSLDNILNAVYTQDRPAAFFPIRHHSPGCAYHVEKAIELYQPDCALIEGPSDTDSLIPCLLNAEPPVSIYYSYADAEGRRACYYPLLDYSPELAAIRAAAKRNIPIHFIDLPYGNVVLGEREMEKKEKTKNRQTYFDDYFLQRSHYIASLCEKENCRDYGELWEKLFELPALSTETEIFIKNLTALCYYSRIDYPEELLAQEQNLRREAFMAEQIVKKMEQYRRVLVVTGGFHTPALMELTESKNFERIKPCGGSAYLIPYSFEECDKLTGYESGMPYPGYYQGVYENLVAGEKDFFQKTSLAHISKLAKILRQNRENISLSEEAAAFSMGLGLASLRGKNQSGAYEFLDGIRSCFVKGELNLATSFVIREATILLRGKKTGRVGKDAPVPPIVLDFEERAKSFRMDISTSLPKTLTLDIVSKGRHREQSVFLHRLSFLEIPFGKQTYGPDYENKRGTRLVREKWDYSYSGAVASGLIEKSHLGGSIEEACESRLMELLPAEHPSASSAASLLVKAAVMGLFGSAGRLAQRVEQSIALDHSFVSLADSLRSLSFLRGIEGILRIEGMGMVTELETQGLTRIIPMIPLLSAKDESEDFDLAQSLKLLSTMVMDSEEGRNDSYAEALMDLLAKKNLPPSLDGAATGILYNLGRLSIDEALGRANAYFAATGETLALSGRFLRGAFLTARDLAFYDEGFLRGLNNIMTDLSYDDFIKLLPDLRLSFAFFSPQEINQIAKKVTRILEIAEDEQIDLTKRPVLDEKDFTLIAEVDRRAMDYLREKGYVT